MTGGDHKCCVNVHLADPLWHSVTLSVRVEIRSNSAAHLCWFLHIRGTRANLPTPPGCRHKGRVRSLPPCACTPTITSAGAGALRTPRRGGWGAGEGLGRPPKRRAFPWCFSASDASGGWRSREEEMQGEDGGRAEREGQARGGRRSAKSRRALVPRSRWSAKWLRTRMRVSWSALHTLMTPSREALAKVVSALAERDVKRERPKEGRKTIDGTERGCVRTAGKPEKLLGCPNRQAACRQLQATGAEARHAGAHS